MKKIHIFDKKYMSQIQLERSFTTVDPLLSQILLEKSLTTVDPLFLQQSLV